MTVQDLIDQLQECNPSAQVLAWDPGEDRPTKIVKITFEDGGEVLIEGEYDETADDSAGEPEPMLTVQVIEYIRPNGFNHTSTAQLPASCETLYRSMETAGYRFEAEVLQTGWVFVTISDDDFDLDSEIVPNGPEVQEAMERMLTHELWTTHDSAANPEENEDIQ